MLSMLPGIIIGKAQKVYRNCQVVLQSSVQSVRHQRYSSIYRFCHHFAAAFLSARTSIICPVMEIAISAGVSALISSPTGETIRSSSCSVTSYSSTSLRKTAAFFCTASDNPDITCWCGKKLCLYDCVISMPTCHHAAVICICDRDTLVQMIKITKYRFNCIREKHRINKFRAVVQNDTAEINTC